MCIHYDNNTSLSLVDLPFSMLLYMQIPCWEKGWCPLQWDTIYERNFLGKMLVDPLTILQNKLIPSLMKVRLTPYNYSTPWKYFDLGSDIWTSYPLFSSMKILWERKWQKNLHHYPPPWKYYSRGSDSQPFTRIMIMCKICLRNFHTTIHYDASLLEYYVGWSMGCQILEDPSYDKT